MNFFIFLLGFGSLAEKFLSCLKTFLSIWCFWLIIVYSQFEHCHLFLNSIQFFRSQVRQKARLIIRFSTIFLKMSFNFQFPFIIFFKLLIFFWYLFFFKLDIEFSNFLVPLKVLILFFLLDQYYISYPSPLNIY